MVFLRARTQDVVLKKLLPEVMIYLFPLACGSGKDGMMPTMTLTFDKQISVPCLIGFSGCRWIDDMKIAGLCKGRGVFFFRSFSWPGKAMKTTKKRGAMVDVDQLSQALYTCSNHIQNFWGAFLWPKLAIFRVKNAKKNPTLLGWGVVESHY